MSAKILLRPLAVLAALAAGALAPAYEIIRDGQTLVKWANGNISMQVKLGSTPTLSDGSNYSSSTVEAMNAWNLVMRNSQFAGTTAIAGSGGRGNGISELFFSADVYGEAYGENVIAVTLSSRSSIPQLDGTHRRTESDILFNTAKTWDSYRGSARSALDIRRVALHELGHSLGLDHPDETGQSVSAIMNSHVSSLDALTRDDLDGVQFLYGIPGASIGPVNDLFANATAVTIPSSNTLSLTGSSLGAAKESGEPNHASGETGGASVWWKWTATASGTLTVQTAGTNFDTLLAAYTGSAVGSLTQVTSNDDVETPEQNPAPTRKRTSIITVPVTSGTTYYFAVDGWQGEWGSNINLQFDLSPVVQNSAPTITTQPQSQTVTVGGNVTFTVAATGVPSPTFQWNKNGTAISGATSVQLSLSNVLAADAGTYTVTVTNSVGSVTSNGATLTVNAVTPPPSSGGGGGGGGGGAPSHWFFIGILIVSGVRFLSCCRQFQFVPTAALTSCIRNVLRDE